VLPLPRCHTASCIESPSRPIEESLWACSHDRRTERSPGILGLMLGVVARPSGGHRRRRVADQRRHDHGGVGQGGQAAQGQRHLRQHSEGRGHERQAVAEPVITKTIHSSAVTAVKSVTAANLAPNAV
jgi:hypothetical protein